MKKDSPRGKRRNRKNALKHKIKIILFNVTDVLVSVPRWAYLILFFALLTYATIDLFHIDAILAPILKAITYVKYFLAKTFSQWVAPAYIAAKKSFISLLAYLGGWEAWSIKKISRAAGRFIVSTTVKFIILNAIIAWCFHKERKGIKKVPVYVAHRLRNSWLGIAIDWWKHATERQKSLIYGFIIGAILIMAGYVTLGMSIWILDIALEILLIIWRGIAYVWRLLLPYILKFISPKLIEIFTLVVIPFFVNLVPMIRHDDRVLYIIDRYKYYKDKYIAIAKLKREPVRKNVKKVVPHRAQNFMIKTIHKAAEHKTPQEEVTDRKDDSKS